MKTETIRALGEALIAHANHAQVLDALLTRLAVLQITAGPLHLPAIDVIENSDVLLLAHERGHIQYKWPEPNESGELQIELIDTGVPLLLTDVALREYAVRHHLAPPPSQDVPPCDDVQASPCCEQPECGDGAATCSEVP